MSVARRRVQENVCRDCHFKKRLLSSKRREDDPVLFDPKTKSLTQETRHGCRRKFDHPEDAVGYPAMDCARSKLRFFKLLVFPAEVPTLPLQASHLCLYTPKHRLSHLCNTLIQAASV
jgi:hypothetical protein